MNLNDEDSRVSPRFQYKLRNSGSLSPKKKRHVSPLLRGPPEPYKRSSTGTMKKKPASPPAVQIEELKNLYCCNIPTELLNRDLLREHFEQFGQVFRVYISFKKSSCTIHFKTHEAASAAKLKGNKCKGYDLNIFWSKPATKSDKRNESEAGVSELGDSSQKRPSRQDSTDTEKFLPSKDVTKSEETRKRKAAKEYEMQKEVVEELQSMAQADNYQILPGRGTEIQAAAVQSSGRNLPVLSSLPSASKAENVRRRKFISSTSKRSLLEELLESWQIKSKLEFHSAEERYQILELRDKILRIKRGKQTDLSKAEVTRGTCQDMCPEKERYQRESRQQLSLYEISVSVTEETTINHNLAVKQYLRSSADQEEPLPHELRPAPVLRMTMDYLLARIVSRCENINENLGEWYHFIWDRTRAIRKDITQQELCDITAVNLVEECARFHVHCSSRLVAEKISVFDSKINSENLTKCLQTLKYMYYDMSLKGIICENEAEFRAYIILMNLNDSNFLWEMKELREEIFYSEPVQFAMKMFSVVNNNNYVKFFKMVKETTYLNACVLLRYFYQIRLRALHVINKSHGSDSKNAVFTLREFTRLLAFENQKEAADFCNHHGLCLKNSGTEIIFKSKLIVPSHQFPVKRVYELVETKRNTSVAQVIKGGLVSSKSFDPYKPSCSFTLAGTLKKEVVDIFSDQKSVVTKENVIVQEHKNAWEDTKQTEEIARQKEQEMGSSHIEQKAVPQAGVKECDELMSHMVNEIIGEEFGVFCERLDNVAFLELDEIMLDVTCIMTRDAFRQSVTGEDEVQEKRKPKDMVEAEEDEEEQKQREEGERKLREEKERKLREEKERKLREEKERKLREEEEERKVREEEERKCREEEEKKIMVEKIAEKTADKIVHDTVTKTIWDIANYETELHNVSIEEMETLVEEILYEDSQSILEETVLKSKLDYLADRRKQYCCKKYYNVWRRNIMKLKLKRRSMEDFPAWFSPLSAKEQVSRLATPPPGTGIRMEPLVIPLHYEEKLEDLRLFDIAAYNLIIKSKNNNMLLKYYKLVVSIPDAEESPAYAELLEKITDITFPETQDLKMESPPTLLERKAVNQNILTVSLRRLVGLSMLERGAPCPGAVCGMNGLIFVMCQDTKCVDVSQERLYKLLKLNKPYGDIQLAVLLSKEVELSDVEQQLQLNLLRQETNIKINVKYFMRHKGAAGFTEILLRAMEWLTSVHESVITPYCTSAFFLVNAALRVHLWKKFTLRENRPYFQCDKMKFSLYMAIKIYNRACKGLCELLTDEEVNSCNIGAPEFAAFIPVHDMYSAGYRVMPHYFGTSEYKEVLRELFRSIEFVMPPVQLLRNEKELDQLLLSLCQHNQICEEVTIEIQSHVKTKTKLVKVNPNREEWVHEALKSFSWISVLQIMMNDKIKTLDFMDPLHRGGDKHPIMVAASRSKLDLFVPEQWLSFLRANGDVISKERLVLRNQFSEEMPNERALKRKKTTYEDFPLAKRLKCTVEVPSVESFMSTLDFGKKQKKEIDRFLKYKKEVENLSTMIAECSRRQQNLDERLKEFFGSKYNEALKNILL